MYCMQCKTPLAEGASVCSNCGTYAAQVASPQPTVIVNNTVKQSNPMGIAGFVLAVISIVFSWVPGVGWLVWFLGALFSVIGLFKSPKGLAIAGTVLSFIDLIILIAIVGAVAAIV